MTYADLKGDLLDTLLAVANGCKVWPESDPRIFGLLRIDERLLFMREVRSNRYEYHLGSSGYAYLAGLARGRETRG